MLQKENVKPERTNREQILTTASTGTPVQHGLQREISFFQLYQAIINDSCSFVKRELGLYVHAGMMWD